MKNFALPNLWQSKLQVFSNYIFNKKSYSFKFVWNDEFCIVDIYIPQNEGNLYLIKGHPIVPDIDLISRVKNPDLVEGKLYIRNKFGKDIVPDIYNFHTDFELVYYGSDETEL